MMPGNSIKTPLDWEVIYENGSVFTSLDGAYWEAPRTGIMMVLQGNDIVGIKMLHSSDGWWVWKDSQWFGVDRDGKDDYRRSHMSPELCILEGRWVSDYRWMLVQRTIRERKSGWFRYERRVKNGGL